jgi:hypothetical protein
VSVEFEPVKLRPRRRRIDPVAIATLVVVLGLAAAVIKPWNAEADPATSEQGQAFVDASPSPRPPDSLSGPRSTAVPAPRQPGLPSSTASLASWDRVRGVLRVHDGWGIRAIVAAPSGLLAPASDQQFAEHWDALPDDPLGFPTVDIEPNDRTVVAIGITFPAAHTPLDVRIWLVHPDRLEWIDTLAVDPSPSGGAFLYRVANGDGSVRNWAAGRYRVDVLVDGAVRRFGFTLPNRFEIVPDGSEPPLARDDLIDPAGGALPDLPIGLFLTASGVSIPLPGEEGPALTEAGAWLNVDPGTGRAPRSHVAAVLAPAATGIGIMLPPGSIVQRSVLRRLAPEPLLGDPELVRDDAAPGNPTAHVLYRPPGGGAWLPGVYRISVVWADSAGLHDRSWHLELRPGPVREQPSMLLAARGFARYAGSSGVVVGTAEPLEGGPRSVAIRLLRAETAPASGIPARDRVPCDGIRVDGLTGVIGLAGPVDAPPSSVVAHVLFEYSRSGEQPILVAGGDVPGLILVAPAGSAALTSDVYRVRLGDTTTASGSTVCLRTTPAG